uniref:Secreted protein n=1 Tax=Romanomermis culicivorax TaxID=13658 RepID=A0A915IM72_ROMCU
MKMFAFRLPATNIFALCLAFYVNRRARASTARANYTSPYGAVRCRTAELLYLAARDVWRRGVPRDA